ncbi:MAG: hypothetical protein M3340_11155 [Actinomycetota bacterium]|nr:hypothetical protein [Actinomycetota bacterium]
MAVLQDPPKGWEAMVELLALDAPEQPPPPEPEPEPRGFLARVFRALSPTARAVAAGDAYLRPLGLHTTDLPTRVNPGGPEGHSYQEGATVVEGERHGRSVEIRIDAGRYRTHLSGPVEEFHVRSEDGRLMASERSSEAIRAAVESLSPDDRWKGVEATGGPDGVSVVHRVKGSKAGSQGLWFDDLWLAEALAEIAGGPRDESAPRP